MAEQLCCSKRNTVKVQLTLGIFLPDFLLVVALVCPFWVIDDTSFTGIFYICSRVNGSCYTNTSDDFLLVVALVCPFWVIDDTSFTGIFYICSRVNGSCYTNTSDDTTAFPLASLFMMIPVTVGWVYAGLFCNERSTGILARNRRSWFWIILMIYMLTGVQTTVGCIIFMVQHDILKLGLSYYCCLATGLNIILMVYVAAMDYICKESTYKSVFHSCVIEPVSPYL